MNATCTCGHVEDEHNPRNGSCEVEDCLCGGFEPAANEVSRAEQSAEYLNEARWIIAACLADGHDPEEELEAASIVLGALAAAGWHLLNHEDAEAMLAAYVMQQIR